MKYITNKIKSLFSPPVYIVTGLIRGLRPANERHRYKVMLSLIGWAQTKNQPYHYIKFNLSSHDLTIKTALEWNVYFPHHHE